MNTAPRRLTNWKAWRPCGSGPACTSGTLTNGACTIVYLKCWITPLTSTWAGHRSKIDIVIHVDGSISIVDNGRGIPVDIHPKFGIPAVELVLTNLHAGGKFGQGAYKILLVGGMGAVAGAKCANALLRLVHVRRCAGTASVTRSSLSEARRWNPSVP